MMGFSMTGVIARFDFFLVSKVAKKSKAGIGSFCSEGVHVEGGTHTPV